MEEKKHKENSPKKEHHEKNKEHQEKKQEHNSKKEHHPKKEEEHNSKKEHHEKNKEHQPPKKENKKDEKVFTVTETNLWRGATALLGIILAISIFTGGFGITGGGPAPAQPAVVQTEPSYPDPSPPARVDMEIGDSPVKGSENAPVTMIEFSDFECPFCARFYTDALSQIQTEYIDTGKVKLAYKHLPLPFHPEAKPAALASECAREQGKFWEYHDIIFENQAMLGTAKYKEWADQLGLDKKKFDQCFDSGKYNERIEKDLADAERAGLSGTPAFLINGKPVVGALPFQEFKTAIEAELNG